MYEMFNLPLKCVYKQTVYNRVEWKQEKFPSEYTSSPSDPPPEIRDEQVLIADRKQEHSSFDVFSRNDLISSIYLLFKKMQTSKNKQDDIKKWVEKYGFLGCNIIPQEKRGGWRSYPSWESLADFLKEAGCLADLWDKYRQVTQNDLSSLREWIRFVPEPEHEIHRQLLFWPEKARAKADYYPFIPPKTMTRNPKDTFFYRTLDEIEAKPLWHYQIAGIRYIARVIEDRLQGLNIISTNWEYIGNESDTVLKTEAGIECRNLLQAMYLQFFMLMADPGIKKVCPVCGHIFPPREAKHIYCSEKCANTAKARRYRGENKIKRDKELVGFVSRNMDKSKSREQDAMELVKKWNEQQPKRKYSTHLEFGKAVNAAKAAREKRKEGKTNGT